ncbi:MAG: hypothetical protein IJH04_09315 [Eggerthellaceae bacterium]|nr:hypothetical protein [Eggerthellaceae bacterium]
MDKHTSLEVQALSALTRSFKLHKVDLGKDAHLKKSGMAFDAEAWEIEGIGHLCIMKMKAFLGLMRMETVVIAPTQVDLPLFNADWVNAAGTETQMVEFYDTQLEPWPHASQARFHEILDRYGDVLNGESTATHWYDPILYSCSCRKTGRKLTERLSAMTQDNIDAFVAQLAEAPACDADAKAEKVRTFAETLFSQGGPAVDQVTKLFGAETARRLVVGAMYGVKDA